MAALEENLIEPIRPGLPPPPSTDFFQPAQWEVLYSLLDAVLPAVAPVSAAPRKEADGKLGAILVPGDEFKTIIDKAAGSMTEPPSRDALEDFFSRNITEDPRVREDSLRMLAMSPRKEALGKLLSLMNTYIGSRLLTGYWGPITSQPSHVRQAILQSWITSRWPTMRSLGKSIASMALKSVTTNSSLLHQLSGYRDVPRDWKATESYDFKFIQPGEGADIHTISTDAVVVGSGCGGAVCAMNLAQAGHDVLVVDKGYSFPASYLPMSQAEGTHHLFENAGIVMAENGGLGAIAGSNWGGGGTVNWSVCLKLEEKVREEWAGKGLPFFSSPEYDECVDRVWEFSGASTAGIRHSHSNRVLLGGAKKLGWAAAEAPQNTAGKVHDCGQCLLGCGSGGKRGPTVSWLPAAGEAGAQFMEGFQVDKVLFDEDGNTAVSVEGVWTSRGPNGRLDVPESERVRRKVRVQAKKVIIAAGSFRSPVILMASGIENPQLGKNLHLHPSNVVTATFGNDTDPNGGGIITSCCSEFDNQDGEGHGVKLEPTCMVPYTCLTMFPWRNGVDTKLMLLRYQRLNSFIAITRDRDSGEIRRDPVTGRPLVDYTVSEFDQKHAEEGVVALTKILYVSGADEIQPYYSNLAPFVKTKKIGGLEDTQGQTEDPEKTDPAFAEWLRELRAKGNKPPSGQWSAAHQMGSCRMGASPEEGVVDERGKVWGKEGLYVADSSVFPSASGVNPMITIQAIADWISRGVDKELRG
ncbi:unnamed protein product [Clonostachys rosea]|uniref:Long-chain-alcohol oxidase n=1 Tax=Bionectria ochroleuca TaxID=29856 RepID=A0ABY6UB02_BIOOC|nr:unnamed protein product [Clonostachys rosea]